jgi:hypothetical protein
VRRGRDTAEIYSIAIARDLKWLAVSSDKGTVHVFSLVIRKDDVQSAATSVPPTDTVSSNARSSLSFMKGEHTNSVSSSRATLLKSLPHGSASYITSFSNELLCKYSFIIMQIHLTLYKISRISTELFQFGMVTRSIPFTESHTLHCCIRRTKHCDDHRDGCKVCTVISFVCI